MDYPYPVASFWEAAGLDPTSVCLAILPCGSLAVIDMRRLPARGDLVAILPGDSGHMQLQRFEPGTKPFGVVAFFMVKPDYYLATSLHVSPNT